jgi:threonine dehydratase
MMVRHDFAHIDLTDNELAKMHIRHMVGGRSAEQTGEVLYRFEFPERSKALTDFLVAMSENWNISLFHYRMHGGDFGRVLVGFEIPEGDQEALQRFLHNLHYPYVEETDNPAYTMFL